MSWYAVTKECERGDHQDCIVEEHLPPDLIEQGVCGGGKCSCKCHKPT